MSLEFVGQDLYQICGGAVAGKDGGLWSSGEPSEEESPDETFRVLFH